MSMSTVKELALKSIVSIRPPARTRTHVDHAAYVRWQFSTTPALLAKFPKLDLANKRVLEIGCGTGGRSAYFASLGAATVVGIDINRDEIEIARREIQLQFPTLASRVEFLPSTEHGKLDIGEFDVVVLIDCLEHVVSPPDIVRLAHAYTKPGGTCYVGVCGWYHAWGSHFSMMPFLNVFFSDEEILNVQRWLVTRPNYVPTRFDSKPPIERWRGLYDLRQRPGEYLNKITLREMKKLIRYSPFKRGRMNVVGWKRRSPLFRLLNLLRFVPYVQEAMHSYVVLELEK
jgi:SAM-dependent methyltransferase